MSDFAAPAADSRADQYLLPKLATGIGLAAVADFLFYGQRLGLSVTVFAAALICISLALNHALIDRKRAMTASIVIVAGLAPTVEDLNVVSLLFSVLATTTGVALLTDPETTGPRGSVSALCQLLILGPLRLPSDAARAVRGPALARELVRWCVPLAFGAVFVILFARANPVIEQWLAALYQDRTDMHFDPLRALFWAIALLMIWPFVQLRWQHNAIRIPDSMAFPVASDEISLGLGALFSPPTVLRSLVLFNLLFALQTTLDIIYLWGHVALPPGMTYAAYAHRGAYPLIVTALLAAAFVLIAIRPGDAIAQARIIRPLVYLWVGQNVMLVLSAILRLKLYVGIYLLTYWRVTAAIWMGLVAIGLVLIVARIALDRSHRWLIRMNLLAVLATLYVCSLINFDAIIANYNVVHSHEAGGAGVALDGAYVASLGPQAIPALAKLAFNPYVAARLDPLLELQARDMASWRSWSFRGWRLQRYLDKHPIFYAPN
jgi:Domain of unknown function (DUF4173)